MTAFLSKLAYFALVIGWYAIRVPHQLRARRTPVASSLWDLAENVLLAVSGTGLGFVPMAYVFVGFDGIGDRPAHPALLVLGSLVAALSLALFYESHRGLGRSWSFSLELRRDHRLRIDGLYAYVRHPMYAAFWLWALAQAILLPNWIAGLSGLVGFGTLYLFRVPREERMMSERFGDAYRDYCRVTPRVLPWKALFRRR